MSAPDAQVSLRSERPSRADSTIMVATCSGVTMGWDSVMSVTVMERFPNLSFLSAEVINGGNFSDYLDGGGGNDQLRGGKGK